MATRKKQTTRKAKTIEEPSALVGTMSEDIQTPKTQQMTLVNKTFSLNLKKQRLMNR